jgi:hypothetical protein
MVTSKLVVSKKPEFTNLGVSGSIPFGRAKFRRIYDFLHAATLESF